MRLRLFAIAAVCSLLSCTLKSGSGKGRLDPRWKVYKVEHPRPVPPYGMRNGALELHVEAVVLEERRTVIGPEYWNFVIRARLVNHGPTPLPAVALIGAFQVVTRSGQTVGTSAGSIGNVGWTRPDPSSEATQLPPGAAGSIEISARIGSGASYDEAAALVFGGERLAL